MAKANEGKWFADFLISEANLYRARGQLTIPQGATVLEPGTLLQNSGAVATTAANTNHILAQRADPRDGAVQAAVVSRAAEVNDAYIVWGSVPRVAGTYSDWESRLGLIVRFGVYSASGTFLADEPLAEPAPEPPAAA